MDLSSFSRDALKLAAEISKSTNTILYLLHVFHNPLDKLYMTSITQVVMELRKQSSWSKSRSQLFHFRSLTEQEVDVIFENTAGRLVAIEVKASATINSKDFRGLRALADARTFCARNQTVVFRFAPKPWQSGAFAEMVNLSQFSERTFSYALSSRFRPIVHSDD